LSKLTAERSRQAIVEYTRRLAESAATAGPDAPVPTTPKWTVTNLVEHVGQTQHWVAEIIERRITDPTQLPTELVALPADPTEWQAWLSESAQRVADACSDDAIDAPVFNAAGDERSGTEFWMTSMVNEAVVHGFDASNAAGTATYDIAPDVASALITNHLAMLTSPTWEMRRPESAHALRGTGQTLQWQATDTDTGAWHIERHPTGATWHPKSHPADTTITAPAGPLLLTMTRRLPLTAPNITLTGDPTLAHHWLDNTAHVTD
jgi:uncharacterized protein (TIGR03083 family)